MPQTLQQKLTVSRYYGEKRGGATGIKRFKKRTPIIKIAKTKKGK
jgi:hypothetical protein